MLVNIGVIVSLLLGLLLLFCGNLGIIRFPDVFCRAHALTKAMTLGIIFLLVATILYLGWDRTGIKVLVIIAFQFTTIPLSGHILGLIAYEKNLPRWKHGPVIQHRK